MLKTIPLLILLSVFNPSLSDVSDYENWQQGIPKYVTEEVIPNRGFVAGKMTLAPGHHPIIGLVDQDAFYYTDCGEGCGYFVAPWEVKAFFNSQGLAIYSDGVCLYQGDQPYTEYFADVKVAVKGEHLYWYLNGEFLCSTHHPEIAGKELRGFYQDDFAETLVGIP